jgi:hypothetical protein
MDRGRGYLDRRARKINALIPASVADTVRSMMSILNIASVFFLSR